MADIIKLPQNWDELDTSRRLIAEGWHTVQVADIASQSPKRAKVVFMVLDESEYAGWSLYETFTLENEDSAKMFKKFTETIGVETPGGKLDVGACKYKVLRVKVRHNTDDDGQVWANVVAHARDRA